MFLMYSVSDGQNAIGIIFSESSKIDHLYQRQLSCLHRRTSPRHPLHPRYGLGIRFLREEYAAWYRHLDLPLPLPPAGVPDTDVSVGGQEGLPVYASHTTASEETFLTLCTDCVVCLLPFDTGDRVMQCHACGVMKSHVRCLAARFIHEAGDAAEIIPHDGYCPKAACATRLLWSQLVRDVQRYCPASGADNHPCEAGRGEHPSDDMESGGEGNACGRHVHGSGDRRGVWLVDDSSDDDDSEGGSDDEGYNNCSDASVDLLSDAPMESCAEDNDWQLDGNHGCSQGIVHHAVSSSGMAGPATACRKEMSIVTGNAATEVRSSLLMTRTGTQVDRCGDNDICLSGSSGDGEMQNGLSPPSPPRLPLAERLRLRRLAAQGI